MITKKCSNCNIEKPLDCFYKSKDNKFGVGYNCKECTKTINNSYRQQPDVKERIKKYRQQPDIKEKINKRNRERYDNSPEFRERILKKTKIWRAKNKIKLKKQRIETINRMVDEHIKQIRNGDD